MEKAYYPLNKVPGKVEKMGGKRVSLPTVYRWTGRGIQSVRLRTLALGGTLYTCDQWLEQFFQAGTEARLASHTAPPAPTRRESLTKTRAEAILAEAGI